MPGLRVSPGHCPVVAQVHRERRLKMCVGGHAVVLSNQQPAGYGAHDRHRAHEDEGQLEGVDVSLLELAEDVADAGRRIHLPQAILLGPQHELAPQLHVLLCDRDAPIGQQIEGPAVVDVQQHHGEHGDPDRPTQLLAGVVDP